VLTGDTSLPAPYAWDVEPGPEEVPAARRLIVKTAASWQVPLSHDALRDVELCASELLANAIEHTRSWCRVTVAWTGERLRVEVWDSSLRLPEAADAEDTATGGRGLLLVRALAHSWGWIPQGAGKAVWFECAADQALSGKDGRLAVLVRAACAQLDSRRLSGAPASAS
jgi:anti-sigma regulatory factor (Ser/Thr protein kinase)